MEHSPNRSRPYDVRAKSIALVKHRPAEVLFGTLKLPQILFGSGSIQKQNAYRQVLLAKAHCMERMRKPARETDRAPITKQMFGRMIRKYKPEIREFQRTVRGARQWMYGV